MNKFIIVLGNIFQVLVKVQFLFLRYGVGNSYGCNYIILFRFYKFYLFLYSCLLNIKSYIDVFYYYFY